MLTIKNIKSLQGQAIPKMTVDHPNDITLDGEGRLTLMPALIDPHVHFRTPGDQHKENWLSGSQAAIAGGITTVFDMPNNTPPCVTRDHMTEKMARIDRQLKEVGIPLRYALYFGAHRNYFSEIPKITKETVALKIYMGSSTGGILMDDASSIEKAFKMAAEHDLLVGVHAECEDILRDRKKAYVWQKDASVHSTVRSPEAALRAATQAIELAAKHGTRLIILHMSTKEEVELVRQAKKSGISVYSEVTPHHLFLTVEDYARWGTLVQMNPPVREQADQDALWEGIEDGTIDTLGSDHAPHLLEEKTRPYGEAPSGVPGIETSLPLMITAYHNNRITLETITRLMRTNIEKIYRIPPNKDLILIDLEQPHQVVNDKLNTRCKWSPFYGRVLRGWPRYVICRKKVFEIDNHRVHEYALPV